MQRPRVFIDGHEGTTGLRIHRVLERDPDLELLTLDAVQRKDPLARREAARGADLVVLCLPDEAAREAVSWIEGADTRILDASTAHRVAESFVYGLPELEPGRRERIAHAMRVSNPGCYATAVVLLLRPLIDAGLLAADAPLAIHALSGYTGGGRQMIEHWESAKSGLIGLAHEAPYSLGHPHKHLPEMTLYSGLSQAPAFVPAVGPFASGMRVEVPLPAAIAPEPRTAWQALASRYAEERFVRLAPFQDDFESDEWTLDPQSCNDTNRIDLFVAAHSQGHLLLIALLDNLGKGACGAALQNLNLMLGFDEDRGLAAD